MNPTPDHIDKYLRNELTAKEQQSFESAMAVDPTLKEQVAFDQTIAEGLSNYRKAELKARMDAIDVTTTWVGQLGNSTLVKTVGALVTAGVIGVGAYVFVSDSDQSVKTSTKVKFIENIDHPKAYSHPQFTFAELEELLEEFERNIATESVSVEAEKLEAPTATIANAEKKVEIAQEEATEEFYPAVNVPVLGDVSDEKSLKTTEVQVPIGSAVNQSIELDNSLIDVDIKKSRNGDKLSYKYFDGKLFLYGEFGRSPYEILEVNKSSDKSVYLYYDQNYYIIKSGDEIQPLIPITSESLLGELEILRNNKL